MSLKHIIVKVMALAVLLSFTSTTAFADINLGNDDGAGFQAGTSNNYWGVYTDSGVHLNETEGLRVTIYNSNDDSKVFNTIDITGNPNIAAVSDIGYFANGSELISKTAWLNYVGTTYNSISSSDMTKFNNTVLSKSQIGGYMSQYIAELSSIDIISENNTANLEKIKTLLGKKEFLVHLASLIGSGLTYEDIADGKYKIAFEPVAYFRYNGQNWAMSATECGLLNKYMKNYFSAGWNSTNNLRALLGPLTHSQLPRSAFLESKDLGISTYIPTDSDYYNGNNKYNSDTCIIRCMGIGVLSTNVDKDESNLGISFDQVVAEYHTDTDVYTSFRFVNESGSDIIASCAFSIYNELGETPRLSNGPIGEQVLIKSKTIPEFDDDGNVIGIHPELYYGYLSDEVGDVFVPETQKIRVFIENPRFAEKDFGVAPYISLGSYKDGDFISVNSNEFSYTISRKSNGAVIKRGTVSFSCPDGEEAMGWFEWHTPTAAQDVIIAIESVNSSIYLLDEHGNKYNKLIINAGIEKVVENTPPDPKVTDKQPSWQKIYSMTSVKDKIAEYAPADGNQELTWYVWSYDWIQERWDTDRMSSFDHVISPPNYSNKDHPYLDADTEKVEYWLEQYGVDNRYYRNEKAAVNDKLSGSVYTNAVILSGQAHKVEYCVSISADMAISPSDRCHTATYSNSTGKYTMKSGYGIQIEINAHLSGDTEFCTGSQAANVLFPEFNYNRQSTARYNRLLEKVGNTFVFKNNEYSTYNDRVHFTPIWYPDKKNYTVYAEVFDIWCPAGQLSIRLTDQMVIRGNVYDDWHIAPVKP